MRTENENIDQSLPIKLRLSWRFVVPRLIFVSFLILIIVGLSFVYSTIDSESLFSLTLALPLFFLLFVIFMARPVILLFDCKHEVSFHHVRSTQGICSLKKQFIEIPYEDMLGVRSSQTIMERVLDIGSIIVWTASAEVPDLIMKGIREPEKYTRLIGRKIDGAIIERRSSRQHR